jgi:hypothetical protein
MHRILMLALALLCSAAWLQAQDSQNPPSGSSKTDASSNHVSVEGCLQGSNGSFTITDSAGTTYQLQGDTRSRSWAPPPLAVPQVRAAEWARNKH